MTSEQTLSCKVEGCKRPYRAKGYCVTHYKKWRRGEMPVKSRYKTCSSEKCRKAIFKFGLCKEHYQSWVDSRKGKAGEGSPAAKAVAPVEAPASPPAAAPALVEKQDGK